MSRLQSTWISQGFISRNLYEIDPIRLAEVPAEDPGTPERVPKGLDTVECVGYLVTTE